MFKSLRNNFLIYYTYSYIAGLLNCNKFRHVHTLLVFLGYPRSGSSILGSILDAHKNILIAHELNILNYIKKGYTYKQLFFLLARNSRLFTRNGRISSGYIGLIEGQFNGKAKPCLVIGDKKAGATSGMLEGNPEVEQMLLDFYSDVKFIHIVRNPFDMIATQAYKGNEKKLMVTDEDLTSSILFCEARFRTIDKLIKKGGMNIFTVNYESLISEPERIIASILTWLGVDVYDGYINACKAHLFQTPHQSRHEVSWTDEQINKVNTIISRYYFLMEYSFEN